MFNIHLAKVYGFCRGVQGVTEKADRLLAENPDRPVYSIGKLVHNDVVVDSFSRRGLKVVDAPDGNPPGIALIRAHGIPLSLARSFEEAGFTLVDGTCRLVKANHDRCASSTRPVLYFGIKGHAESVSTLSHAPGWYRVVETEEDLEGLDPQQEYDVIVQTTFSSVQEARLLSLLEEEGIRFNRLNSICSASNRRRQAVLDLCGICDTVLVIGERQSANTSELYRLACSRGVRAFFVGNESAIEDGMLSGHDVGVCAGASVSPHQVDRIIEVLVEKGGTLKA